MSDKMEDGTIPMPEKDALIVEFTAVLKKLMKAAIETSPPEDAVRLAAVLEGQTVGLRCRAEIRPEQSFADVELSLYSASNPEHEILLFSSAGPQSDSN